MSDEEIPEEVVELRNELGEAYQQRAFQREEDAGRIALLCADVERLGEALKEERADAEYYEAWAKGNARRLNEALANASRFRLAWLSARRRAADEANFGMEALELKNEEIARLTAELTALRESTHAAPELEHVGTDEDGAVYRLKRS